MAHTTRYDPETHSVETKIRGYVSLDEMKGIFSDAMKIALEKDVVLFLSDFRQATINLSTLDIYELPRILSEMAVSLGLTAIKFKRAIVIAEDFTDFQFSENVTSNQGQTVKFFYDIEEAKKWLFEK
jgi:hypothetical protein